MMELPSLASFTKTFLAISPNAFHRMPCISLSVCSSVSHFKTNSIVSHLRRVDCLVKKLSFWQTLTLMFLQKSSTSDLYFAKPVTIEIIYHCLLFKPAAHRVNKVVLRLILYFYLFPLYDFKMMNKIN